MTRFSLFFFLVLISACTTNRYDKSEEKQIFKSWVLSRCLSFISTNHADKHDADISASAYLEQLSIPLDALLDAEQLIKSFIAKDYRGSISGSFNTKKCIDLANSKQLDIYYGRIR